MVTGAARGIASTSPEFSITAASAANAAFMPAFDASASHIFQNGIPSAAGREGSGRNDKEATVTGRLRRATNPMNLTRQTPTVVRQHRTARRAICGKGCNPPSFRHNVW